MVIFKNRNGNLDHRGIDQYLPGGSLLLMVFGNLMADWLTPEREEAVFEYNEILQQEMDVYEEILRLDRDEDRDKEEERLLEEEHMRLKTHREALEMRPF